MLGVRAVMGSNPACEGKSFFLTLWDLNMDEASVTQFHLARQHQLCRRAVSFMKMLDFPHSYFVEFRIPSQYLGLHSRFKVGERQVFGQSSQQTKYL